MKKPKIIIVGAGLGGCMLAHALRESHDITLIERGAPNAHDQYPIHDVGTPAGMWPHVGAGPGGSTQLWHNGLIEIDEHVFAKSWPFPKRELAPYYERSFKLLSALDIGIVRNGISTLRKRLQRLGLPAESWPGLFYPHTPINVWQSMKLAGCVNLVNADVVDVKLHDGCAVQSLIVNEGGQRRVIEGDLFVYAAGGLGTPILLQEVAEKCNLPSLQHAGFHYEDHPMGFVGEVEVTVPLYKLWNFKAPGTRGNLRLPLVIRSNDVDVSFQLRPAASFYRESSRERVGSVLNDLRREPLNVRNYLKLFSHRDDVLDILSFKFGINLPTKHYTLLMMAEMPPSPHCAIWAESAGLQGTIQQMRNWVLSDDYRASLKGAIDDVLRQLQPIVSKSKIFPSWWEHLKTGAHHSGTARMSMTPEQGVCDSDCLVHGMKNLYVCDGSVIPASGIANTGLTIGALALRLGTHLQASRAQS